MKPRALILTDHDIYGGQPCGAAHAMQTLVKWLAHEFTVDIYSLHGKVQPSNLENVAIYAATLTGKAKRKQNLSRYLNNLDSLLIRYFRRGFNKAFEWTILRWKQRKPVQKSFYSQFHLDNLIKFLSDKTYDVVIVEYLNNTYLLDAFTKHPIIKILDLHDVMHLRAESFARAGVTHSLQISESEEYEFFSQYDYLMAIQDKEAQYLLNTFRKKVLTVPRPYNVVTCPTLTVNASPVRILFFASKALFNLHAYDWFIENVWPLIRHHDIELLVAGTLCEVIGNSNTPNIRHLGLVASPVDAYSQCHFAINPIQIGSGLKIKNIESLAHGRAMLTTSLGADGLNNAEGHGLIIANGAEEFSTALIELVTEPDNLAELGTTAQKYIAKHFNSDTCFQDLDHALTTAGMFQ